jgi:hypothetical protein
MVHILGKFIPKYPVKNVRGRKMTVTSMRRRLGTFKIGVSDTREEPRGTDTTNMTSLISYEVICKARMSASEFRGRRGREKGKRAHIECIIDQILPDTRDHVKLAE